MPTFNIGEVVELNSGGVSMTVELSTSEKVEVIYYCAATGDIRRKELSSYCVKLVKEPTNSGPSIS
jgi:hypothetical protein